MAVTSLRGLAGSGIDRFTGKPLIGWPHVVQCLGVIFTTNFGERVMREYVGSLVPKMLGQNISEKDILPFWTAMWTAIATFEPRYHVDHIVPTELTRLGSIAFRLEGEYRPRAHLGDFTPEGGRKVSVSYADAGRWYVEGAS